MKRKVRLLTRVIVVILGLMVGSCVDYDGLDIKEQEVIGMSKRISEIEAIEIATNLLSKPNGRSVETPYVNYLMVSDKANRSKGISDTVAYILNYPDRGGFAIIANDNRINPIIAYSDTGYFSLGNEVVGSFFTKKIATHIATIVDDIPRQRKIILPSPTHLGPYVDVYVDQFAPFNKFVMDSMKTIVDELKIVLPVGCMPLATATVMLYSNIDTIALYDEVFYPKFIVDGLRKPKSFGLTDNDEQVKKIPFVLDTIAPVLGYSYAEATNRMAKLLFYLGKYMDTEYIYSDLNNIVSNTLPSEALLFLKNFGYTDLDGYVKYNLDEVVEYLLDHIILVYGYKNENKDNGHAWIFDGLTYLKGRYEDDYYIHCNWGQVNGICNGYYKGEIFKISDNLQYPTKHMKYIPVKRNIK